MRGEIEEEIKGSEWKPFGSASLAFARWRLEKILKRRGYLAAQVQVQRMPPYKEGGAYAVDWTAVVNAGPKYHISSISVDGGPLFEGKDLAQLIRGKVGGVAGDSPFASLDPQLRAYYQQFGFADIRIMAEPTVDKEHATVAYALKVIPGPVYHLRSLTVEKLSPEQEGRVRELLAMKPGDLYREAAINNLYHKIAAEPSLAGYSFGFDLRPTRRLPWSTSR